MHKHDGMVVNELQTVAHRMKARFSADSNADARKLRQTGNHGLAGSNMVGRQYENNLKIGPGFEKCIEGVQEHGPALEFEKLLGRIATHPCTGATGNNNSIFAHAIILILVKVMIRFEVESGKAEVGSGKWEVGSGKVGTERRRSIINN
jgi:hypothetical protein